MKQKKIDALAALRLEKEALGLECSESEANLTMHWEYVRDNIGSLLLSNAIDTTWGKLGFGKKSKSKDDQESNPKKGNGIWQGLFGSLFAMSPFIWEIIQPMIIGFGVKKVKSIFSRKKKKK